MRKLNEGRPFDFVPDITKLYFTFNTVGNWFYTTEGFSDEYRKRNGWKYDGQFFFKEKKK